MDRIRQTLLGELQTYRYTILSQLADHAEEQGNEGEAQAWRWLRDNKKWPGYRKGGKCAWQWSEKKYRREGLTSHLPLVAAGKSPTAIRSNISEAFEYAVSCITEWLHKTAKAKRRK